MDILDEFYKEWQQCNTCIGLDFELGDAANYTFCFDLRRRRFLCPVSFSFFIPSSKKSACFFMFDFKIHFSKKIVKRQKCKKSII